MCRWIGCGASSRSTCSARSRSRRACWPRMVAKGAGRIIIVSSIAGVMSGPSFGPYSMTKHVGSDGQGHASRVGSARHRRDAVEPGSVSDRIQRPHGRLDVGVVRRRVTQRARDAHVPDDANFVTNGQMDPAEVVTRMVELTEADTTTENNFVPPEILAQVAAQLGKLGVTRHGHRQRPLHRERRG